MSRIVLYHNPGCSKSRGALEILQERGVEHEVVEYLETAPERADLEGILARIPEPPAELVRKDKNFKELGLDAGAYETADAVVSLLLEHPQLMQRPIALLDDRGVIARPSDKILELIEG